jgi:hypothetical protein
MINKAFRIICILLWLKCLSFRCFQVPDTYPVSIVKDCLTEVDIYKDFRLEILAIYCRVPGINRLELMILYQGR